MNTTTAPPTWFKIVSVILVLWELAGCYACYSQFKLGAAAMGPVDDWSLKYYAALPLWYNWVYAAATFSGLLGGIALLTPSKASIPLFWISLAAVIVMFGYAFAATDLIAHKGLSQVLPFPLFIAAMGAFSVWLAGHAARMGWLKS